MLSQLKQILVNYHGVLITAVTLAALEMFGWAGIRVPNPAAIYLTAVVYAAYQGGFRSGLVSTAITLLYAAYFFSTPGQMFTFTTENAMRVLVLAIFTPLMASMVSVLRRRVVQYTRQLEAANQELARLATTDMLTRLKNRRALLEHLDMEVLRAQRSRRPLSLLFLDVDRFKDYNDSFGHAEGDRVLQQVAELLRQNSRATDIVGRYGGEEFLVILPDIDRDDAIDTAQRVRLAIAHAHWPLRDVTASLGVATLSNARLGIPKLVDSSTLIAEADQAVYYSKEHGRNRVTHSDSLDPHRGAPRSGRNVLKLA